jgi:plasmid stabilization system protein ParE
MPSGYKIKWTNRADKNVDDIKDELKSRWSKKVSRTFLADLYKQVSLISDNPKMFPKSEKTPR